VTDAVARSNAASRSRVDEKPPQTSAMQIDPFGQAASAMAPLTRHTAAPAAAMLPSASVAVGRVQTRIFSKIGAIAY
jgi:hypothetical protein